MTEAPPQQAALGRAALDGAALLRSARGLLLWALGAALVYSSLSGSKGSCPGGYSSDGGYLDAAGQPTDVAPQCATITLQPSPIVFLALTAVVLVAITRAARAADEATAQRRLTNGAILAVGTAVGSMIIAVLWFQALPLPTVGGAVWFPFPFGGGTLSVTPLDAPTGG